jgi:hypothetical protein
MLEAGETFFKKNCIIIQTKSYHFDLLPPPLYGSTKTKEFEFQKHFLAFNYISSCWIEIRLFRF